MASGFFSRTSASWAPQDGVDHAILALAALRQRRAEWHAIFVGDGDGATEMRQLVSSLGLDGCVESTGRIADDQSMVILSTADVCLAPDPKNPLNDVSTMNKIVEYMAMGRPIVWYGVTEARVSTGEAAAYAEPNDPAAFASCIDELLNDHGRRAAMGSAGLKRLQHGLSWGAF